MVFVVVFQKKIIEKDKKLSLVVITVVLFTNSAENVQN